MIMLKQYWCYNYKNKTEDHRRWRTVGRDIKWPNISGTLVEARRPRRNQLCPALRNPPPSLSDAAFFATAQTDFIWYNTI